MYVLGLMWCPALAGMLTLRLNGRSISELGWKWGETKYQIQSWFIPLLYASLAYVIVWVAGFGAFGNREYLDALNQDLHPRASRCRPCAPPVGRWTIYRAA